MFIEKDSWRQFQKHTKFWKVSINICIAWKKITIMLDAKIVVGNIRKAKCCVFLYLLEFSNTNERFCLVGNRLACDSLFWSKLPHLKDRMLSRGTWTTSIIPENQFYSRLHEKQCGQHRLRNVILCLCYALVRPPLTSENLS